MPEEGSGAVRHGGHRSDGWRFSERSHIHSNDLRLERAALRRSPGVHGWGFAELPGGNGGEAAAVCSPRGHFPAADVAPTKQRHAPPGGGNLQARMVWEKAPRQLSGPAANEMPNCNARNPAPQPPRLRPWPPRSSHRRTPAADRTRQECFGGA